MEGRALSPDMVCRDSEEPGCSGVVLPDASTGHDPDTRQLAGHKAVTPRPARSANRRRAAGVQGGYACPDGAERRRGRGFCKSRYKFYRSRACRGTKLISRNRICQDVTECYIMGTGAVSRYKFDRSQSASWRITVQD